MNSVAADGLKFYCSGTRKTAGTTNCWLAGFKVVLATGKFQKGACTDGDANCRVLAGTGMAAVEMAAAALTLVVVCQARVGARLLDLPLAASLDEIVEML